MKKVLKNIDRRYCFLAIVLIVIAFVIPSFTIARLLMILLAILSLTLAIVKNNKFLKKNKKYIFLVLIFFLILMIFIDTVIVCLFKRVPIFAYNITTTEKARVYNGIGYRVWQCDKKNYKNLKVDVFYQNGYSCDALDVEEIDSNSFLNSVIENYDLYKNNVVKIRGKISKKNGQNYIEMQPYENAEITVNGYVTFADNITLRIVFNDPEKALDQYDVYDEIVIVGTVKNMDSENNKYVVYMYDSKVLSEANYDKYEITVVKDSNCNKEIVYSSDDYDVYLYCLSEVNVSYGNDKFEIASALSSGKLEISSLFNNSLSKKENDEGDILYNFKNYKVIKCNSEKSKDIIIGAKNMSLEDGECEAR